jgi:hypothetical protein
VGRSYYALFNVLLGVLSGKGVIFRGTPDDHYTLISYLTRAGNKASALTGSSLKDLRPERNNADYDMRVMINAKTSEFVYQKARRAMQQFESISPADLDLIVERVKAIP